MEKEYSASFTSEQFLFYEMRTTAQLVLLGLNDKEIIEKVTNENLFQYPTEKSNRRTAIACLKRIHLLDDEKLIEMIADGSSLSARQVCLYTMMKQYRVINEFMVTVIGEKYRLMDFSFSKRDVNVFFTRLQEQNDVVASWSDWTIKKLKQVIVKLLVDNEYLDNTKSEVLNVVLIDLQLKNILLEKKDYQTLSVFNCFEGE